MIKVERDDHATARVVIDSSLYNETVVYKAFYWYAGSYEVDIASDKEARFVVRVRPKEGELSDLHLAHLRERVHQDLIDFKTRHIIETETRAVRELLVAKAFAHGDEFDETPPGDPSDPVGFRIDDWE